MCNSGYTIVNITFLAPNIQREYAWTITRVNKEANVVMNLKTVQFSGHAPPDSLDRDNLMQLRPTDKYVLNNNVWPNCNRLD